MRQLRRTAALTAIAALVAALGDLRAQPGRHADRPAAAVPGVDGPLGTLEADTPAIPWEGGPGSSRTTDELMSRGGRGAKVEARAGSGILELLPALPNVTVLSHGPNPEPDTNAVRPDASGDVGPTQYLLAANGRLRTHAKSTGLADGVLDRTPDEFFATVRNGVATSTPRVRFDRRAGRWIVMAVTAAVPNRYLVAVSSTATIAGSTSWAFLVPWTNTRTEGGVGGAAACYGDDATLSLDQEAIYIGVNQRCGLGLDTLVFDSTSVYVVRRSALLQGSAVVSQFDGLVATPTSQGIYAPQGALNFDVNPPHGYIIGVDNMLKNRLVLRRVANPGTQPTLSSDVVLALTFNSSGKPLDTGNPIDVPTPGGLIPLDGLDHRLAQAVVRNGRLWTSHHFEVDTFGEMDIGGGRNGVRWYELATLSTAPTLVQAGTVWDSNASNPSSYWNSSIMVSGQGHAALGMSSAGAQRQVRAAFTARLAGDPADAMDPPTLYTGNTGFIYNLEEAPKLEQAWGRTSATSLDPSDDMTLWTLQQFVDATDSYGLRLLRIQAPPPPATILPLAPATLPAGTTGASVTVTGLPVNGSGFFDPGPGFPQRLAAAFSGTGVTVTAVAYNSPSSITLTVDTVGAATGARTLTVTNPDGQTTQRAAALTITAAPGTPVAVNDNGSTPMGTTLNVPAPGVLANDTDPEGQPLTAQLVTSTTHGALTLNASGSLVYNPNAGFTGVDSFTYRAFDGTLQSNVATVTISVGGANRAPVFGVVPGNRTLFDPGSGVSSGPLPFTVSDPDGTPVSVTAASSNTAVVPAAGVVVSGSGTSGAVTISTAGATSLGSSTITLTASDGSLTAVASFVVTVMTSTVPGAPQNLVAAVSRSTVLFTWQAPSTAATEPVQTYVLDVGLTPGATAVSQALGNVLSFTATGPDGTFFVRVRAVTPAGSSPPSNEVVVTIGQSAPPLPPLSLLATVQGTTVTLAWTENPLGPTISGYQIQAGTASGLADLGALSLPAAARSLVVDAVPGTYFVRVVALNAAGSSPPSNEAVVTAGPGICTIPAVPTGLVASSTGGVLGVQWSAAAAGAIPLGYVLQAGSIPGGADRGTVTLPVAPTAVSGPVPAGPYFIRVAAANACGVSAPSAEVSVMVP